MRFPSLVLFLGMLLGGCGGSSGTSGTAAVSEKTKRGFGGQAIAEKPGDKSAGEITAPAETAEGILLVFDKVVTVAKGPGGPTNESVSVLGEVVDVSPDLSRFTVRRTREGASAPKIGDPVTVYFQWPLDSRIGLTGSLREDSLATGTVERVEGDDCLVRVNEDFSGAKIVKGAVALVRWY